MNFKNTWKQTHLDRVDHDHITCRYTVLKLSSLFVGISHTLSDQVEPAKQLVLWALYLSIPLLTIYMCSSVIIDTLFIQFLLPCFYFRDILYLTVVGGTASVRSHTYVYTEKQRHRSYQ